MTEESTKTEKLKILGHSLEDILGLLFQSKAMKASVKLLESNPDELRVSISSKFKHGGDGQFTATAGRTLTIYSSNEDNHFIQSTLIAANAVIKNILNEIDNELGLDASSYSLMRELFDAEVLKVSEVQVGNFFGGNGTPDSK